MQTALTRRALLRLTGVLGATVVGGVALSSCGASAAATASTTSVASSSAVPNTASTTSTAASTSSVSATQGAVKKASLELEFWNPATDKLGKKIIAQLVAEFNKQSNTFQTKDVVISSANHYTKYVTAMASGQPPDAIMTYDYFPMPTWASQGFIIPLDSYAAQQDIKESDYFPIAWEMIHFHGHLWGFLQEFDFNILAYNKDLFQAAGLDPTKPPKTIPEMDAYAQKLIKKKSDGSLAEIPFAPWVTGSPFTWAAIWGGGFYDVTKGEFTIVTDPNISLLEWYIKYSDLLGGPDKVTAFTKLFTGNQTPFYANQMAMEAMGEYTPITIPEAAPHLNYAVAFPPTAPGVPYGTAHTGGGNVFVIPKGVKHEEQSVVFIKWMGGPEAVLQWNVEENNNPPVKSVALSPAFAKKVPLMVKWIDLLKLNLLTPPVISPIINYFSDQLTFATQQVIYHKATPKEALTQLNQKAQVQLKQFKTSHPNW
ncbi:MAG: extracellular solute-binding protein [Chloroflexi bacterium]|nr:extracellular solute-binding protein [Chloroflexota bacterium]